MSLIAKMDGTGEERKLIDPGLYRAICTTIVDLGTHYSEKYDKDSHWVRVIWELPDEIHTYKDSETGVEEERPGRISKKYYSISLHPKATLAQDLEGWRAKPFTKEERDGFDLANILGKNCMLNIIHDSIPGGDTFAKVAGITPIMKGMKPAVSKEQPIILMVEDEDPAWMNEFMKADRDNSKERMASTYGHEDPSKDKREVTPPTPKEDEVPF